MIYDLTSQRALLYGHDKMNGWWFESSVILLSFPRDPIAERQRMVWVYNHLRNATCLGSMKPFSVSVIESLAIWVKMPIVT